VSIPTSIQDFSCVHVDVTSDFKFVGTNAYWLPYLNSDDDIRNTLANMSNAGINVVRTWAFNGANGCSIHPLFFFLLSLFSLLCQIDVTDIPDEGSWLQLIKDGTTQINTGPNGIQRLDKLIEIAKSYNIYVYLSLTNNWFPSASASVPPSSLPRNFLSNNFGQYLILIGLCANFPDCIFLRWYGHLRSRVWRIKDT